MADTQYLVLARHYNQKTNSCVTNKTDIIWKDYRNTDKEDVRSVHEVLKIQASDSNGGVTSGEMQQLIIKNAQKSNPKYDMVFAFRGVDMIGDNIPNAVCDAFYRLPGDPWIKNSISGSLAESMNIVKRLGNAIGKDNVLIGKIVPLEQYIDIV